jgi:Rap1a immunity proteins
MYVKSALRFFAILFLVLLGPGGVHDSGAEPGADAMYGDVLMNYCQGMTDTDIGLCSGYIMAVAEGMAFGRNIFGQNACGHDGIRAQQLVDLVKLEIAEHPGMKAMPAGVMVAGILARSFPCYDDIEPASGD